MSEKILATISADDFIGRAYEAERLLSHAKGDTKSPSLLLLSAPDAGASELLKQIYDRIFQINSETIPFYFAVKESDRTAKNCAVRFMQTFVQQAIAFRHREPKILEVSPGLTELADLSAPDDRHWVERLVAVYQNGNQRDDERAFIRSCMSAPLRASAHGLKLFLMIDDLHEADFFTGEINFIEQLKDIFNSSKIPFVLSGRRRFLFGAARAGASRITGAEILKIERLKFSDAGLLAENLAGKHALEINEPTRDLIARQFDGNTALINFLLEAAGERRIDLDSFQVVEQIYTDELFGGRIGKFYDAAFRKIAHNVGTQKKIIELLTDMPPVGAERRRFESDEFQQTIGADANRIARLLDWHEIIRLSSNWIETAGENEVLNDYLRARYRLEIAAENRATVVGEMLAGFLKRAPRTMAKFYRRAAAVGLREILSAFNCQEVPTNLIDYSAFNNPPAEAEKIRLPQIIYTAHTAAFYPPLNQVADEVRSAVALGFEERAYTNEDETVWIAAEIESKLEASREKTEFWCDRLEMVALTCNFPKYKLWLVAPEGFAPEAIEILRQRNAYGSSRRQVEQLRDFLSGENSISEKTSASEYEIVVPMGEDTELIAANAAEEIARKHRFEPKAINQIKTALVEACINATEHSLSPDRKIYQKFAVEDDRIVITISNRGLRLTDVKIEEIKSEEGRRGWGLKLMRTLMDDVKIEQVDDGTRISMVKYLKR
jgi:serine/threonine-protein kinase RsbW